MSRPNSGAQIAPTLDVFYSSRLMLGEETGDTHLDLVEVGHPDPSQAALGLRLGMTPCTGEAHLASGSVAFGDPLSSAARWDTAIHATIDLDADGRDEVVTLTTSSSDPTQGVALVSHVLQGAPGDGGAADAGASGDGGSEPAWQISDPVSLGLEFNRIEAMGRPPGETRGAVARKADLDGDGYPDLVALGTENGQNVVAVFFNDRGGTLGAPVVVRAPSGASADSFALVQADSDPEKELLLLAGGAAYLTDCKGRERTFSVAPSPVVTRAGASLVACGDFDGDGIEDVALGGGGKIELFAGKPSLR